MVLTSVNFFVRQMPGSKDWNSHKLFTDRTPLGHGNFPVWWTPHVYAHWLSSAPPPATTSRHRDSDSSPQFLVLVTPWQTPVTSLQRLAPRPLKPSVYLRSGAFPSRCARTSDRGARAAGEVEDRRSQRPAWVAHLYHNPLQDRTCWGEPDKCLWPNDYGL